MGVHVFVGANSDIAPGLVKTKLSRSIVSNERGRALSESLHPLGRLGDPGDVASMVCYLLDPKHSWITGEVIRIDGGLSTLKAYPSGGVS
jgi:3-oxoacyl-[acyl-carrier protein] reductase